MAQINLKTCSVCRNKNGEIYQVNEMLMKEPPIHLNCRCVIEMIDAILAGQATKHGKNGADWWIKNYGHLPAYYITIDDLMRLGWKQGKALAKFAHGKMATRGIY